MNRKLRCVANVQYKKPSHTERKRQKGLLRYLTYRDGREGHLKQRSGVERWHDLGLGGSPTDIAERCEVMQGEHVLAWTMVLNPNPELTRMVANEQREGFVCALTERTLSRFFEARGIEGGVEASYVLHHRQSQNPESPGLPDPHTHVILPGTYFDEGKGQRENLFFSRSKRENHIELLHRITEEVTGELLDIYVGRDWEQRVETLEGIRTEQRAVTVHHPPHGISSEADGVEKGIWAGLRRTDEATSAVGYYASYLPDRRRIQDGADPDEARIGFRPLLMGLNHETAQKLAEIFEGYLTQYRTLEALQDFVERLMRDREAAPIVYTAPEADLER